MLTTKPGHPPMDKLGLKEKTPPLRFSLAEFARGQLRSDDPATSDRLLEYIQRISHNPDALSRLNRGIGEAAKKENHIQAINDLLNMLEAQNSAKKSITLEARPEKGAP